MFTKAKNNIPAREEIVLFLLLVKYGNDFSKNNKDLGKLTFMRHRIMTYNEDPVREIRNTMKFQDEEENTLTDLFDAQVIRSSTPEWASALVLVRKKEGEAWYSVDYRQLNVKIDRRIQR